MNIESKPSVFPDGKTVTGMLLPQYLDWIAKGEGFAEKIFLPSIQRGFVWSPPKIVHLWDSLLRGMPVGSLLLNHLKEGSTVTSIGGRRDRNACKLEKAALGLLDGQQRTSGMLVGWPSENDDEEVCVWIDLGETGHDGSPFELRISTPSHPFGFQRYNHKKFSMQERRDARSAFIKNNPSSEESSDTDIAKEFGLTKIRPWKGRASQKSSGDPLLCPLKLLWQGWVNNSTQLCRWDNTLPDLADALSAGGADAKARFKDLMRAFERLNRTQIPLVLVANLELESKLNEPTEHPLIVLIERISTGGERLSTADLLFSMIKQIWPDAHNLVNNLHNTKVQHLMTAGDFVMTAFRLAVVECNISNHNDALEDLPDPRPRDLHRRLSVVLGDEGNPGPLRKYIMANSPLEKAFDLLHTLIIYQPTTPGDNGIPELMMPFLPRPLIQILLLWVMQQLRARKLDDEIMQSRNQVISFVLFWYLCAIDANRASQDCIKTIMEVPGSGQESTQFPGLSLYALLTKTDEDAGVVASMLPMLSVEVVVDIFEASPSSKLRSFNEKIKKVSTLSPRKDDADIIAEEYNNTNRRTLLDRFWWKKSILLWLQRDYLCSSTKFKNHKALAGKENEDTVPYDYDHLCPYDEWRANSRKIGRKSPEPGLLKENLQALKDCRDVIGNGIGNFNILHFSDNREFGNDGFDKKVKELKKRGWSLDLGVLPVEDEPLWVRTSNPLGKSNSYQQWCWTDDRVAAFQEAVDRRFLYLYGLYYAGVREIIVPPLAE